MTQAQPAKFDACQGVLAHAAGALPSAGRQPLGVITWGQGGEAAADVEVPCPVLAGPPVECWHSPGAIEHGEHSGVTYAHDGDCCFGHLHLPDDDDLAAVGEAAYRSLLRMKSALGYPYPVRIWHYLRAINAGKADDERYKRFCVGRARALDTHPAAVSPLPAATVVGGQTGGMRMHFLLARTSPAAIENPRQVSAFRYPRRYGPRQPTFARASLWRQPGQSILFLSGTASIVGHETRHRGDVTAQLEESLNNADTVIGEAAAAEPALHGAGAVDLDGLKVYLRDGDDLDAARTIIADRLGDARAATYLRADLCRRELLVEVEGHIRRAQDR